MTYFNSDSVAFTTKTYNGKGKAINQQKETYELIECLNNMCYVLRTQRQVSLPKSSCKVKDSLRLRICTVAKEALSIIRHFEKPLN